MKITRKDARKSLILDTLKEHPAGLTNVELGNLMGLNYRAIQAATQELSTEDRITGYLIGTERYGCIQWRLARAQSGRPGNP